jgi:hypothetical protein
MTTPTPVQQEWQFALSVQQQSVLLMACRGPDGMRKSHPAKALIRAYRACVLNAASTGKPVHINNGDTYMSIDLMLSPEAWGNAVVEYLYDVDEIPHHYHLHFLHGAQILGYKHPDEHIRACWLDFYRLGVEDMHLYPESEDQMDARLNDFGRMDQP